MLFFKELDMFGGEFKFKRKGSPKFKTARGEIISLLTISSIIVACIYFTNKFIGRGESTTVVNIIEGKDQYINFSTYPIMLRLSDGFQIPHENWDKIWNISLKYHETRQNLSDPEKKTFKQRRIFQWKNAILINTLEHGSLTLKIFQE